MTSLPSEVSIGFLLVSYSYVLFYSRCVFSYRSIAVIKGHDQKGGGLISLSLKEVRTGTQIEQEPGGRS